MYDRAHRHQGRAAGLGAIGRDNDAHGLAVEIGPLVVAGQLQRVERVLHHTGKRAMIAGRRQDDPVGLADRLGQLGLLGAGPRGPGVEVGQALQEFAAKHPGPGAGRLRPAQRQRQRPLRHGAGARRAANPDDQGAHDQWSAHAVSDSVANTFLSSLLSILPLALRGRVSGQKATFTGTLKAARRARTKPRSSLSVATPPGFRWTTAAGSSPRVLWGMPTMAASMTAGWSYSTFSTSTQ